MQRYRHTTTARRVLELDVGAALDHRHPAQLPEGSDDVPAREAGERWHRRHRRPALLQLADLGRRAARSSVEIDARFAHRPTGLAKAQVDEGVEVGGRHTNRVLLVPAMLSGLKGTSRAVVRVRLYAHGRCRTLL